jgi:hypothetical protein
MAPMAAVLPKLKICTMAVRTPDSLTMRATASGQVVHVRVQREFPLEDHTVFMIQ